MLGPFLLSFSFRVAATRWMVVFADISSASDSDILQRSRSYPVDHLGGRSERAPVSLADHKRELHVFLFLFMPFCFYSYGASLFYPFGMP